MQLPRVESLPLLVTKWASILNPVLANQLNGASILKNVSLTSGNNQIAHLLGRMQQGWFIVDQDAAANIYRYAGFSPTYLFLNTSADVTVNLAVF